MAYERLPKYNQVVQRLIITIHFSVSLRIFKPTHVPNVCSIHLDFLNFYGKRKFTIHRRCLGYVFSQHLFKVSYPSKFPTNLH